jgi:hypothetical protein
MTATVPLDRQKLGKILGLLGSHHAGERDAAARMAHAMVREARTTWAAVLKQPPALLPVSARYEGIESEDDAILYALARRDRLTAWEAAFTRSLAGQSYSLSPKQRAVLDRLVLKLRRTPP